MTRHLSKIDKLALDVNKLEDSYFNASDFISLCTGILQSTQLEMPDLYGVSPTEEPRLCTNRVSFGL